MIYYGRIVKTLNFINDEYDKYEGHSHQERSIMFSKLAVLELCGWIEECFDEIALNGVRNLSHSQHCRVALKQKLKATHGFHYTTKAKPLLQASIGTARLVKFEKNLMKMVPFQF